MVACHSSDSLSVCVNSLFLFMSLPASVSKSTVDLFHFVPCSLFPLVFISWYGVIKILFLVLLCIVCKGWIGRQDSGTSEGSRWEKDSGEVGRPPWNWWWCPSPTAVCHNWRAALPAVWYSLLYQLPDTLVKERYCAVAKLSQRVSWRSCPALFCT